jgi:lipopolysaccharide transport system ATP-binding protein
MEPIIRVENIGKKYRLKHLEGAREDMFLKQVKNWGKDLFRRKSEVEEFWALQDISFDVMKGDRVGIIGRNGAGKSTLLKILSRIVTPSTGKIEYYGRIASLLEVGTGFHGDLTGRENIYLNGSILGMSREEINRKFDEIVEFSEVEKFLDTPVKRYSSGMYVRLAFGVAAHLDPEILVVDEVLAVGDAAFQKKCLGKMKEVSGAGKTILFVSHNMAAIQNLCNKSIVLQKGRVTCPITETGLAIKHYVKESLSASKSSIQSRKDREGEGLIRFTNLYLTDENGNEVNNIHSGMEVNFVVETELQQSSLHNLSIAITIYSDEGIEMLTMANHVSQSPFEEIKKNQKMFCNIKKFPLTKGEYVTNIIMYKDGVIQDYIRDAYSFSVFEGDFYGTGRVLPEGQRSVLTDYKWKLQ